MDTQACPADHSICCTVVDGDRITIDSVSVGEDALTVKAGLLLGGSGFHDRLIAARKHIPWFIQIK